MKKANADKDKTIKAINEKLKALKGVLNIENYIICHNCVHN